MVKESLGHGFLALTEDATVLYLLPGRHNPAVEHGINLLCPTLAIRWLVPDPILSTKNREAPSLNEAAAQRLLPTYTG